MITVVRRRFRSSPYRDALQTWTAIVDLLTRGQSSQAERELLAVTGIASSIIADRAPEDAPIVVACDGPRTRIYCVYGDDAIDESDGEEAPLGFYALNGNWTVSLPCQKDDLVWVQRALQGVTPRINARDLTSGISSESDGGDGDTTSLEINQEGFLGQ